MTKSNIPISFCHYSSSLKRRKKTVINYLNNDLNYFNTFSSILDLTLFPSPRSSNLMLAAQDFSVLFALGSRFCSLLPFWNLQLQQFWLDSYKNRNSWTIDDSSRLRLYLNFRRDCLLRKCHWCGRDSNERGFFGHNL